MFLKSGLFQEEAPRIRFSETISERVRYAMFQLLCRSQQAMSSQRLMMNFIGKVGTSLLSASTKKLKTTACKHSVKIYSFFFRFARCSGKVSVMADGALAKANQESAQRSAPEHTLRPGSVITALGSVRTKTEMVHQAALASTRMDVIYKPLSI